MLTSTGYAKTGHLPPSAKKQTKKPEAESFGLCLNLRNYCNACCGAAAEVPATPREQVGTAVTVAGKEYVPLAGQLTSPETWPPATLTFIPVPRPK
jgi:hypothetical protein